MVNISLPRHGHHHRHAAALGSPRAAKGGPLAVNPGTAQGGFWANCGPWLQAIFPLAALTSATLA